jgi:hypothetical protein
MQSLDVHFNVRCVPSKGIACKSIQRIENIHHKQLQIVSMCNKSSM